MTNFKNFSFPHSIVFFLMIRRPPRSTQGVSSAASDVYKRQVHGRGLSDIFNAPHSRHTEVRRCDIEKHEDLEILSESKEAGIFIVATKDRRKVFITGHLEYDRETCLLYTSPSPRDLSTSRMPSSA
eukprot:TRINITY_DN40643_c0_g1_i1.p2 TRINITY_DN40643_c0_g1~~TRINITY_DN40643_c0_g1_i1.p2  ORF type:complete len:127 (+),score=23.36 TRINITY_DN40643_c0_g1_i1:19-399(+)